MVPVSDANRPKLTRGVALAALVLPLALLGACSPPPPPPPQPVYVAPPAPPPAPVPPARG